MWTVQSIKAITNGIVAIVGLLLVLWGSGSLGRRLNWKIGVGVPLAGLGIFALSLEDSGFGNALSVVATLMLAFAAFWSVSTTIEHQRSTAFEQRDLDFKRRSMDEVMQWVRDVGKAICLPPDVKPSAYALSTRFRSLELDGDAVVRAASIFGQEFENKVRAVQKNVQQMANEIPDIWVNFFDEGTKEQFDGLSQPFMQSIEQVYQTAYELKVKNRL